MIPIYVIPSDAVALTDYDYDSIMHYPARSPINLWGSPLVCTQPGSEKAGQRERLSFLDKIGLKMVYGSIFHNEGIFNLLPLFFILISHSFFWYDVSNAYRIAATKIRTT